MSAGFLQPETIALLKLIHLAKHELSTDSHFGVMKTTKKETPILDFVVDEIEVILNFTD